MGSYLSQPITEKASNDEAGESIAYGASSMQGWRMSQEDAHNCCLDFDKDASLFAVYDGHGGHEVADYCSKNLPNFIKNTEAYKKGDVRQALIDAFLQFDATLATPEIIGILKDIAGKGNNKVDGDDSEEVEENVHNLREEAEMPLDQLMAKYQSGGGAGNNVLSQLLPKNLPSGSGLKFLSPYNKRNSAGGASSSSEAGCSTSSASWNTNEADVSSSSGSGEQQRSFEAAGSSGSSSGGSGGSSGGSSREAEQVLDSTTSNGDVAAAAAGRSSSSQVGSSEDSKSQQQQQQVKTSEMPDSSEDVKEQQVSPSKAAANSSAAVETAAKANEAEVNGEAKSATAAAASASASASAADSSKVQGDNECSSSCTPVENGEAEQMEKISSSGSRRRRQQAVNLVRSFFAGAVGKADEDDDEDEDDEDEDDENFDGQPESDDDDAENDDSNEDEDGEEDDDDEEDDDEEDDDDDDEDEEDDVGMELNEEPGSDSGCTAVVALLKGNELYVANAGDSRCVLCRDGQAVELSFDHKPEDQPEMERIVKAGGKVTPDGRVNGGLNLSRALGDHAYKRNKELPAEEQMISALPDIKSVTLDFEKDEFMVLACDGIWNFMSSQKVINFVRKRFVEGYKSISQICEELFDHCLAPNTNGDGTGCDNMTAIIVRFKANRLGDGGVATEVSSVTRKRSVSPNEAAAEEAASERNAADGEAIENSKRFKADTC